MSLDPEFSAALVTVRNSVSGILPVASLLKREAQLARRCVVCPKRMLLGRCPGRRTCSEARKLDLAFDNEMDDEGEGVTRPVAHVPADSRTSDVIQIQSMSAPLTAARGGSNGTSQKKTG